MTRNVKIITTMAGAIVAGAVAFAIAAGVGQPSAGHDETLTSRPAKDPLTTRPADEARARRWLGAEAADPEFRTQMRQLNEDLRRQRDELVRLLEQPDLSDALVKSQLEKVMTAQNAIKRRVVDHVLKIRDQLPPDRRAAMLRTISHGLGGRELDRPDGPRGPGAPGMRRRTPESGPAQPGPRRDREHRYRPGSASAPAPATQPTLP